MKKITFLTLALVAASLSTTVVAAPLLSVYPIQFRGDCVYGSCKMHFKAYMTVANNKFLLINEMSSSTITVEKNHYYHSGDAFEMLRKVTGDKPNGKVVLHFEAGAPSIFPGDIVSGNVSIPVTNAQLQNYFSSTIWDSKHNQFCIVQVSSNNENSPFNSITLECD